MSDPLELGFAEIDPIADAHAAADFLSRHHWPFHGRATLSVEQARQIPLGPREEIRSFWIQHQSIPVGLVRASDLQDADVGSVIFDLRIAGEWRGRGVGRAVVAWLVDRLFSEYPQLHRIEAATRIDHHAMRRVLEWNKFVLEGQLRETWRSDDGTRHNTAIYGRLRTDA